jgi:hypothetical protein
MSSFARPNLLCQSFVLENWPCHAVLSLYGGKEIFAIKYVIWISHDSH